MKRSVAIYVSWVACIFLLAHLFIPHHHHSGNEICLLGYGSGGAADDYGDDCTHDERDCDCGAHPSHHNDVEPCHVKDVYFRADGNKADRIAPTVNYTHWFTDLSNLYSQYKFACLWAVFIEHKPPPIFDYLDLFLCSRGLRAPPALEISKA